MLDVDGVMTDGGITLDGADGELKTFNVKDGHGIKMLMESGVGVAIITGRSSGAVERRAAELSITDIYQKCADKIAAYEELKLKYSIEDSQAAYVGDDVVDVPLLLRVGLPATVADAQESVKAICLYVATKDGGRGAVREVCDLILEAGVARRGGGNGGGAGRRESGGNGGVRTGK
jgi:3-deoxy-D-manno-octulosonate 8-phosphate phosphatase (KDO 8-P phosphatase)